MAKKKDARFTKVLEEGCLLGGSEIWVDTQTGCSIITATPPVLPCWWMPRASRCCTAALPTHRSFDPQGAGHRPAPYVIVDGMP